MSPTELVLAGLAMCKVATVRYIVRKNQWEDRVRDVDAFLEQEVKRGEKGKLSTRVKVGIRIEGDLTEEENAELLRQADRCYVHRMLDGDWSIEGAVDALPEQQLAGPSVV